MKNVDCEYLVNESHTCCHKEIVKGWRRLTRMWPKCVEYKYDFISCAYRESLWDILKKQAKDDVKHPPACGNCTIPLYSVGCESCQTRTWPNVKPPAPPAPKIHNY